MSQLVVNPGSADERVIELSEGSLTLGRSSDNQIPVPDARLSRVHARFDVVSGEVTVTDLKSRNGTQVNGRRAELTRLSNGDVIRCGGVTLLFLEEPSIVRELPAWDASATIEQMVSRAALGPASGVAAPAASDVSGERLRVLLKVSELLSSPGDIDHLLLRIVDLLFQIMDISRAVVLIQNEATGKLEQRISRSDRVGVVTTPTDVQPVPAPASASAPAADAPVEEVTAKVWSKDAKGVRSAPQPIAAEPAPERLVEAGNYSRRIVGHVFSNHVAVLTADPRRDARFDGSDSFSEQSIQASMCAPLKTGAKTIGVLYVDSASTRSQYTGEDLEFLGAFANQAAIAIENSRLYRKIEEEAVLRNNFLRFFPPAVIRRMVEERDAGLGVIETEVTALFADISGFTDLASRRNPREIVDMLNEYFPVMAEVIFRHEGTLEKYIGDAMMAVWGAPFPHADDADRALQAAIEMQQALVRLNQSWKDRWEVAIHIGLNTGNVAAGNIGSERYLQYATIGDPINVASRIASLAQGGEVLISEHTRKRLTHVVVPGDELAPVLVKGKVEPLVVHRIDWRAVSAG